MTRQIPGTGRVGLQVGRRRCRGVGKLNATFFRTLKRACAARLIEDKQTVQCGKHHDCACAHDYTD